MNCYSFFATISSCVYLLLGLYVLILNKKLLTHRLFFYMCFSLFLFSGFAIFAYSAKNEKIFTFWLKLTLVAGLIHYPFALHFCIEISEIFKFKKRYYIILYIPSLIFSFNEIIRSKSSVFIYSKAGNYWEFIVKKNIWSISIFLYTCIMHDV